MMSNNMEIPNLTESQKLYQRLIENLVSVNTGLNDVQNDVAKLNKIVIIGNGEIPLVEQVRGHNKFIEEVRYWTKLVIGLFIAQFVGFTIASLIAYLKFLPVLERIAGQP